MTCSASESVAPCSSFSIFVKYWIPPHYAVLNQDPSLETGVRRSGVWGESSWGANGLCPAKPLHSLYLFPGIWMCKVGSSSLKCSGSFSEYKMLMLHKYHSVAQWNTRKDICKNGSIVIQTYVTAKLEERDLFHWSLGPHSLSWGWVKTLKCLSSCPI